MPRRSTKVDLNFSFFTHLSDFHRDNRGTIRRHYKQLTKRFLDYNDPTNSKAYLRQPQFEALEIYVFLKEFLDNQPVHKIFKEWSEGKGKFEGRTIADKTGQLNLLEEKSKEDFDEIFKYLRKHSGTYANYIFALTMGTGKTILMATSIFYEFLLANKFPSDKRFCHNALVFAPDKTVLQSLKEIETFEMRKVVPPEYVNFLSSNIKFHFLDDTGASLSIIDQSRFNIIISNTQKIILKKQSKEKAPLEKLLNSGKPTYQSNSVYEAAADLYGFDEPEDETSLTTNQRFEKLRRITQLGIYIDEAHHAFGNKLAKDMGVKKTKTSLRTTVDELAVSLERAGTHVVACYNFTGTPYVNDQILPEVVYAFGLQDAINKQFLKKVQINAFSNTRNTEFVKLAVDDFVKHTQGQRHEGKLPKLAFFAATIEELQKELRPAVEQAIADHGISPDKILVNVGDPKLTSNDDLREFNRLDSTDSEKQFILLVNKGREGWNCRSLFGVGLFRQPKSKIFVLQATMRCLRAIGDTQQTGLVFLSEDNRQILEDELRQNFRCSISDMEGSGSKGKVITVKVREPVKKLKLKRVKHQYTIKEKTITTGINLELAEALKPEKLEKYQLTRTSQKGLDLKNTVSSMKKVEDITHVREKREFSELTLVSEIACYLNKPCLWLEDILSTTLDGFDKILEAVNTHNELLYDWIIPRLFKEFYDIDAYQKQEEYEVELIKLSEKGYEITSKPDKTVRSTDPMVTDEHREKSFHLDTYCFDSAPEQTYFWKLLRDNKIKEVYFTGMLTHGQSEFFIQYIDPDSHTVRSYYPDFLYRKDDGTYVIVEVKADFMMDDPTIRAKKEFAEQMADLNKMTYKMIASSTI